MIIEKKFPDINIAVARDRDGKIMEARDGSSTFCETPLMYACRHHWVDLVELFLQYGADPRITTFNGDTAMHAVFRDWPVRENAHRPSIKFTLLAHKVSRILRLLVSSHADTTLQVLRRHRLHKKVTLFFLRMSWAILHYIIVQNMVYGKLLCY